MVVGSVLAGSLGALAGLVIGLFAHWPTAWFALIELGLPSGILGGFLGVLSGSGVTAGRWLLSGGPRTRSPRGSHDDESH